MQNGIHPAPAEFSDMQISLDPILRYFHYSHLPEKLQGVSRPFCELAEAVVNSLPRNAERTVALRKLLEAKDAAVRANVGGETRAPVDNFLTWLQKELADLEDKCTGLVNYQKTIAFHNLPPRQRMLLNKQYVAMDAYISALRSKLALLDEAVPSPAKAEIVPMGDAEVKIVGGDQAEKPIPFD